MALSLFSGQHQMLYTMWVCHFVTIDFQSLKGSTHRIFAVEKQGQNSGGDLAKEPHSLSHMFSVTAS